MRPARLRPQFYLPNDRGFVRVGFLHECLGRIGGVQLCFPHVVEPRCGNKACRILVASSLDLKPPNLQVSQVITFIPPSFQTLNKLPRCKRITPSGQFSLVFQEGLVDR
jgi:hypothetical protein